MAFFPIVLSALIGALVAIIGTPRIISFSHQQGIFDQPGDRKVHLHPVSRLGGAVIFAGIVCGSIFGLMAGGYSLQKIQSAGLVGLLMGSILLFAVGLWDDIRGMRARDKLVGQIAAAIIAVGGGVGITFLTNPWNGLLYLGFWGIPITLFWLVGASNAMNLIDGLDGLATGISLIASITMMVVAIRLNQPVVAVVLGGVAGTTLGFLWFNFHPAHIFLGDTGSMLLGFVLSGAAIVGVLKSTFLFALLIPVLILGIPIFDTAFAIMRRFVQRQPIFQADMGHLHHRLMQSGLSHRKTVLSIYGGSILLAGGALLLSFLH